MKMIPMHARGGVVVAHALVDDEDFDRLSRHRWHIAARGYAMTRLRLTDPDRRWIGQSMHRMIFGFPHGDPRQLDHINRNPLDNRRANLRVATTAQNAQNRVRPSGKHSKHRGVTRDKGRDRWLARAKLNGRSYHLGSFDDEAEAARVAKEWRREHMPFSSEGAT